MIRIDTDKNLYEQHMITVKSVATFFEVGISMTIYTANKSRGEYNNFRNFVIIITTVIIIVFFNLLMFNAVAHQNIELFYFNDSILLIFNKILKTVKNHF